MQTPSYSPPIHLLNPTWLTGFINADGTFGLNISKNSITQKFKIIPQIRIFQDVISLVVLEAIKNMLGQGIFIKPSPNRNVATLAFSPFYILKKGRKEAINLIIQMCNENPLQGAKQLDFLDFCKGYSILLIRIILILLVLLNLLVLLKE